METKPFYQSKTMIFNVLAIAVFIAGYFGYNQHVLNPETADLLAKIMAAALPIANIVLRTVTKTGVSLNGQ